MNSIKNTERGGKREKELAKMVSELNCKSPLKSDKERKRFSNHTFLDKLKKR